MNNSIPRRSTKLKRGTEFIYQGEHVWIELQKSPTQAVVCWSEERGLHDKYEIVDISELKPVNQGYSSIKQVVRPVSPEERQRRESLDDFFDRMALTMPFNCMNCGKPLYANTKKAKRAVTCHLFPKSKFESIATDEANIAFMGADFIGCPCNCHDRYDANSDIRVMMPIYQVALERFETDLKFKMSPEELKFAFTYLKIEWQ